MQMLLTDKVKTLPSTPGVYLMKDSEGSIIYVGKAKNLKRRVQSYFQNSRSHSQKVVKLKQNIKDFDVIQTDTEFEAFMMECRLIQKLKPFFNRKMKSPQAYTFIIIHMEDEFPSIEVTTNPCQKEGCLHFGPYINKHSAERAIEGLKEFCKILCSGAPKTNSPCLNYSIGLCIGICLGGPAANEYKLIINRIIALLNGKDMSILEEMKQKMELAAENFDFETAAKYRDYIDSVNFLLYKEKVIQFTEENKNIAIIEFLTEHTFKLFLIKRNKVLYSEKYKSENQEELVTAIKTKMIHCFKPHKLHLSLDVSKEEIDEAQIIYSYLQSGSCNYIYIPEPWLDFDNKELDSVIKKLLS
jgi:excinuclease ABC subunit C